MDEVTPEAPVAALEDVSVPAPSLDAQPTLGDEIAAEQMPALPEGRVELQPHALVAVLLLEQLGAHIATCASQLEMIGYRRCHPALETHGRKLLQLKAQVIAENQEAQRAVKLAQPGEVARLVRG